MTAKRLFDIFFILLLTPLVLPLLVVTAILVRWRLGSPVLFCQVRSGRHGRPFRLMKFRSMLSQTDAAGRILSDKERLSPFGRFIRSTSLDELPELVNVLRGEMSLVGPRPLLPEYLALYSPEQARRHAVRPGLTGWAQVNGRNALTWEEKFRLDVWYVDNRTFWLDLKILAMTLGTVIFRQGISQAGDVTMPRFTGNTGDR